MAPDNNPFSMSTMSNALQHIRGFAPRASDVPDTRLKRLFNLMTSCEGVGQFKDLTSTFDQSQLQMMASLLTSDSEYFMEVASNKYGSRRVQKLLGISDDVDAFFYATFDQSQLQMMASLLTSDSEYFMEVVRNKYGSRRVQKLLGVSVDVDAFFYCAILQRFFDIMTDKYASYVAIRATVVFDQVKKHVMDPGPRPVRRYRQKILQRFFDIMTDKYASYVAIRATVVFDQVKKHVMYKYVLHYALDIARKQHGCIALNEVLTDADDPLYRNRLLDVVARDALFLSNDPWGNFVVQIHVLKLYDLRCTYHVAVSLRGHCVDLSFKKYGSYIVEKLLEAEVSMGMVVVELLKCDGDRLMRLARSEFGNFVVLKALNVTQEMNRVDLFWDLVQKLMPLRHLLLRSHGSNIANVLESCSKAN
uniref:PUM-HD domain-containing protein n=1 Tax=Brassica oleracea var. oleracea TaxID=109376 RepID=A0A0D3B2H7_BRAOL